jgi:predicted ATPase
MPSPIKTPDQRLRVFVSSTLGELAPERAAARAAIERLRLTPVMFELGARPHPPRELYRAYLDQSHVFLGIYWQRYGWVAPGEAVSGLEDEYRLAGDRPRLLYLKEPAPDREDRLAGLLADLQADDRASYKRFSRPDELTSLVEDDLALLLSERFEAAGRGGTEGRTGRAATGHVPLPLTETVGRDAAVDAVAAALAGGSRLVTLTGAGGIGKTRLAVEVARRVAGDFPDGVVFVPLASVTDRERAVRAIVEGVDTRAEAASPLDALAFHLHDRRLLLVLDNVEQIEGIGPAVVEVIERAPGPRVLLTSRRALRVRGETELPVGGLEGEPARRLFVDRARAVSGRFALTEANAGEVAEIVRRLDGLPLAIELAAARMRVLSPGALLERLRSSLDALGASAGDHPERQRTLRATLDWSYDLLTEPERALLARLAVFAGGWTIEAADAVCAGPDGADVLEPLASLLDKSLVIADRGEAGTEPEPRFRMLETVRTYAGERLEARGETGILRRRHLDWCRDLAERAQPHLCGPGQRDWVDRMTAERANVARAVTSALALHDHAAVVELAWDLVVFYFLGDAVDEPDSWLRRVRDAGPPLDEVTEARLRSLLALTRIHHGDYGGVHGALLGPLAVFRARGMTFETAVALHQLGFVRYHVDHDTAAAVAALAESSALFGSLGHDWGVSRAEAMLGSVLAATGDLDGAERCQRRALDHARRIDSDQQIAQALGQLALVRLLQERYDDALDLVAAAAPILDRGRYGTDAANALDALAVVAHARAAVPVAATAIAAAAAERARLGVQPWPTLQPVTGRVRGWVPGSPGAGAFPAAGGRTAGRYVFETLRATLEDLRPHR